MKYRNFLGRDISQLGFGCMRLPMNGTSGKIDMKAAEEILVYAIENGVNYLDSAYVYHNEKSEEAVGEILHKNDLTDKVYLATKLPTRPKHMEGDFMEFLNESLHRYRRESIDFYLLHNLNQDKWNALKGRGVLKFVNEAKQSGLIKNIGFSFHDRLDVFKSIIDEVDWDFCQIQFNFMDVAYQAGIEGLEYAAAKGLPVAVMEPLKGGMLASVSDPYIEALKNNFRLENKSIASLALDFVLDRPEVMVALSGMNKLEHVKENIQTASKMQPNALPAPEKAFLDALKVYIESKDTISCTGCEYCVAECPQSIDIPGVFSAYNNAVRYDSPQAGRREMHLFYENSASCIQCASCTKVCPQSLAIPDLIIKVREQLLDETGAAG